MNMSFFPLQKLKLCMLKLLHCIRKNDLAVKLPGNLNDILLRVSTCINLNLLRNLEDWHRKEIPKKKAI